MNARFVALVLSFPVLREYAPGHSRVHSDVDLTLNAALNVVLREATGASGPPEATDPTVSVLAWTGDKLEQLAELTAFARTNTTDTDDRDVILRALAIYRSHIACTLSGGRVVYEAVDGTRRVLKVRTK